MNAPILIDLSPEAKSIVRAFQDAPAKLLLAIASGMNTALPLLVTDISNKRLTGIGPFPVEEHRLGVGPSRPGQIGGQLRKSVRWTHAAIRGNEVVGSIGTPIRYAAVHEFGFEGDVQVKPFFRKYRGRDQFATIARTSSRTGRSYRGAIKTASGVSHVKGHTRHMKIPAREPFGTGVAENSQKIADEISDEVLQAFRDITHGKG